MDYASRLMEYPKKFQSLPSEGSSYRNNPEKATIIEKVTIFMP